MFEIWLLRRLLKRIYLEQSIEIGRSTFVDDIITRDTSKEEASSRFEDIITKGLALLQGDKIVEIGKDIIIRLTYHLFVIREFG